MRTAVDPRPEALGLPEADFRTRYAAAVIGSLPAWQIGLLVMAFAVWDVMVSPGAAPTTFLIRAVATLVLVIVTRYVASPATSLAAHRIALIGIPLVITASITLVMIITRADPLYLVATVGIIAYAFGVLQGSLARGILLALALDAIMLVAIGMAALPPDRFWPTVVFLSFPVGAVAVGNRFNGDMLRRLQEVEAASIAIGSFFSDAAATAGDDREAFTMLARRTREALGADCVTALLSSDARYLDPIASATADGVRSLGAGSPDAREAPMGGVDGGLLAVGEPGEDCGRDAVATWFAHWRDVDAGPARDIVRRGVALAAEDAAALTDGLVSDARTASLTGSGAGSANRTGSGGRSDAAEAAGAAGAASDGAAGPAGPAPAGAAGAASADRIRRGLPPGVTAIAAGPSGISVFERSGPRCRMLVLPVRRDDVVVGIVAAWRPAGARPFAASALRLLGALCDAAGIIVERRRAVGLVGDAAARLEAIFAASPIAMVLLDDHGRVQLWNAAAESLTGWASRDVLGRQVDAFATGTRDELTEVLGSVLAGATVNDRQLDGRRRDGTPLHVALHLAPVRDRTGRIVGAIAEVIDIAPRMRLETELLQAQKLESVGRLAGGIAHDFNNMLTAIIGAASMLEVELGPERRARREVEAIQLAADRAAQLTRQLLGFARKAVLAPTDVDLNAIVLGIEPMLERLLGERIAVVTRLDPGAGGVSVDRAQVEQVLVNLAVNARDAMPDGGALLFRTSRLDRSDLPAGLDVADTGRVAVLTVSDTGFGMSDEVRRHAFDPFYTTKEVGQGTGLGLATSYGIIRQSGGDIAVETKSGEGTTFRIYLPAAATAPVPAQAVAGGCPSRSPGGTILLAEDEPNVRDLVRRILERAGYAVLEAPNGEAALSIAGGSGRIDLLLSDVVMPGLSGPELYDRMARSRPELPVVFMSGYVANPDVREALGSREVRLIAKPFATETLLAAVASALRPADGVPAAPGGSPATPDGSPVDATT